MEIKRRLNKIAKRISPQLEVMNISEEMRRMCTRLEELCDYGEEKLARAARKEPTIGQKVAEQRAAEQKEITDHQTAESEENLKDQQESFDERNKIANKSKKPTEIDNHDEKVENEAGEVMFDPDREVSDEEAQATRAPAKKKAKKKASAG